MAEDDDNIQPPIENVPGIIEVPAEYIELQQKVNSAYQKYRDQWIIEDYVMVQTINYMWILWADFHLYITLPFVAPLSPPIIIPPEFNSQTKRYEYVYPITDHGYHLSTSRGEDLAKGLRTMGKFNNTIEKMIRLLVERLRTGGIPPEQEVQVAFQGVELAQRKAFESILNLNENVVVTNFETGEWGEKYMANVKRLADKGYGVPKGSPRNIV